MKPNPQTLNCLRSPRRPHTTRFSRSSVSSSLKFYFWVFCFLILFFTSTGNPEGMSCGAIRAAARNVAWPVRLATGAGAVRAAGLLPSAARGPLGAGAPRLLSSFPPTSTGSSAASPLSPPKGSQIEPQ